MDHQKDFNAGETHFSVLSKGNVDEAEILVEISDNYENLKNPIFIDFDSICRKI